MSHSFPFAFAGSKSPGTGTLISGKPEMIPMRGNDVYLEAPDRTQDLLNIKWTLQCAGFGVRSTWHEGDPHKSALASTDHWDVRSIEQLNVCDLLVVICGKDDKARPELAMMAGLALARGLQVIWIGRPVGGLSAFRAVCQFNTAEDYRKQILQQMYSQSASSTQRLAA
jgi:hypothetical protein